MIWFSTIKGFVMVFLKAIAEYYSFADNRQLLDAGEAKAKNDVFKAGQDAAKKVEAIKDTNAGRSDSDIADKLSKYQRD